MVAEPTVAMVAVVVDCSRPSRTSHRRYYTDRSPTQVSTVEVTPAPSYFTRVSRKGQIPIPAELRRDLGIGAGNSVAVERDGDALIVRRIGSVTECTADQT
jgi:AbrB family looped-hinge helix DNA binding protein